MNCIRKAVGLVAALIAFSCAAPSLAATNEYYTSAKAKEVIDGLIKAYGGADKIKAVDRIKMVIEDAQQGANAKITLYQTKSKIRMDVNAGGVAATEIFDGKTITAVVNGTRQPAPPGHQDSLAEELREGPFQSGLLEVLTGKDRQLTYRGKKTFDGKECDVIERVKKANEIYDHYIDPETHREVARVSHDADGIEVQKVESFGEFKGVIYPTKMVTQKPNGIVVRTFKVTEVSSDFDESVFNAAP
jgi:hypothetical protein